LAEGARERFASLAVLCQAKWREVRPEQLPRGNDLGKVLANSTGCDLAPINLPELRIATFPRGPNSL